MSRKRDDKGLSTLASGVPTKDGHQNGGKVPRAFFNIMADNGNAMTDPQKDFVRFLKDITKAMVGNKGCEHGEILMKALSHFGMIRVPRDRVKQIFTGKRGRQYTVIREEFMPEDDQGAHARFAYRVSKDYGNVFYKDYLQDGARR